MWLVAAAVVTLHGVLVVRWLRARSHAREAAVIAALIKPQVPKFAKLMPAEVEVVRREASRRRARADLRRSESLKIQVGETVEPNIKIVGKR